MQTMTPAEQISSRYRIDERSSIFGASVTLWDGNSQMGQAFQLPCGNWRAESSRHHAQVTFTSVDAAIDRIVFDWEGCQLEKQRLGEWVIDRMAA